MPDTAILSYRPVQETGTSIGIALRALDRKEDALKAFAQAIEINPDYVDAYIGKGNTLYQLKRYDEALAAFEHAATLAPNEATPLNGKGGALLRLQRYEEAIEVFGFALQLSPNSLTASIGRGRAFLALKQYQEAFRDFEDAWQRASTPGEPASVDARNDALNGKRDVYIGMGRVYLDLTFYREALEAFNGALRLDPHSVDAADGKRDAEDALQAIQSTALPRLVPISPGTTRGNKAPSFPLLPVVLVPLALLVIGASVYWFFIRVPDSCTGISATSTPTVTTPVFTSFSSLPADIRKTPENEYIGISYGNFAFDLNRADGADKLAAATALAGDQPDTALSRLKNAVEEDTSDAEAKIYLENLKISGYPHITLVVGAPLTGIFAQDGRDMLQAAYLVQQEYDEDGIGSHKLPNGLYLRILVANSGSSNEEKNSADVAKLIGEAAQKDTTIVGVMGWNTSRASLKAHEELNKYNIPMVSPTASSDNGLDGIFRVAPSDKTQAEAAVQYVRQTWRSTRPAIFEDPDNLYSEDLGADFAAPFAQSAIHENYTVGQSKSFCQLLESALKQNPDSLFFSGFATDERAWLEDLAALTRQPEYKRFAQINIMGGDDMQGGVAASSFGHVSFTTFASFDEWGYLGINEQSWPKFFQEYPRVYNLHNAPHTNAPFGFTRADYTVMLSYDAMTVLALASEKVLNGGQQLIPSSLQRTLTTITGQNAIQGVSGQISFQTYGSSINKAFVLMYLDQYGRTQFDPHKGVQGCFFVGPCSDGP